MEVESIGVGGRDEEGHRKVNESMTTLYFN